MENNWQPIDTAPRDSTSILVQEDDYIYITAWTDDVYSAQGGSGGPSGWFSHKYDDHWGDRPRFDHPQYWQKLPNKNGEKDGFE